MENDLIRRSDIWPALNSAGVPYNFATQRVIEQLPAVDAVEVVRIDELIEKYQREADKFFALAKHYYGDGATIDRYKWSHSLASTYRDFVNDLDSICGARMDGEEENNEAD